jgi:hypothetical protein
MVALNILAHRGCPIDSYIYQVVDSQLGAEAQLGILNRLLTTLSEYPKRAQYGNWGIKVKIYFEGTLPEQKKWIKKFLKYEIAILNKSQCREWVESLNESNRSKLVSINDRRVKTMTLLAVIEKGINDLQEDVKKEKWKFKPLHVLSKIVTELRDFHRGA